MDETPKEGATSNAPVIIEEKLEDKINKESNVKSLIPAPFPQRLKASQKPINNAEILELFKQVKVNISLLDAIRQVLLMPSF